MMSVYMPSWHFYSIKLGYFNLMKKEKQRSMEYIR